MPDIVWTGKINKAVSFGLYYALAFETIEGDFAWAVWKRNPRFHRSDELVAKGRVATEAEAMQAAEQCLKDQLKEQPNA